MNFAQFNEVKSFLKSYQLLIGFFFGFPYVVHCFINLNWRLLIIRFLHLVNHNVFISYIILFFTISVHSLFSVSLQFESYIKSECILRLHACVLTLRLISHDIIYLRYNIYIELLNMC